MPVKKGKESPHFIDRTGEIYKTREGDVEIIEYSGNTKCTIRYEDGLIVHNVKLRGLVLGNLRKPMNHIGEKNITYQNYQVEIIEWVGSNNCTVRFENGVIKYKIPYARFKKGNIKNPYHPTKYGIGFVGIGKYTAKNNKNAHEKWDNMLERCYYVKSQHRLSYKDVKVCEDWHNFQNFAKWYEDNWKSHMEGWELDKDILFKGNKIYSPETCWFVPAVINSTMVIRVKKENGLPLGVRTSGKKYESSITVNGVGKYLGAFDTIEEAFQAYKIAKEVRIRELANFWNSLIGEKCYNALISYKILITD